MSVLIHDVYEINLASSGKLKLRAKRLLAEDTAEATFEACVLLHEAARLQRSAVDALALSPPVTQLASAAEETWCYVEGRDPPRAAETWGAVLRARDSVDRTTAEAMLSKVQPLYETTRLEFAKAVHASPHVLALSDARRLDGLGATDLTRARKELGQLLALSPGASSFWWMAYRLAESAGDRGHAWDALTRARRLMPTNPRFLAMSLLVATWALASSGAEEHLASVRPTIADRATAEVCLMYALAEITLARKGPASERKARWSLARDAADAGSARAETEGLRRNLKATQLLVRELLGGREPTMEILYLAGLGEVAATAKPNANVIDFFTERIRRMTPEPEHRAA